MADRARHRFRGAALIVVLLMSLLLFIIATTFANFQVQDQKFSRGEENSLKAFMMADSGISYAFCHICRDAAWQGQDQLKVTEWVYQEGDYRYGFRVDSYYNAFGATPPVGCPASYIYLVRSAGVVIDTGNNNRLIARRCVRAIIQCTNDYNIGHINYTLLLVPIAPQVLQVPLLAADLIAPSFGFELNVRPDQCHCTFNLLPPGLASAKAFLLRYCDENQ